MMSSTTLKILSKYLDEETSFSLSTKLKEVSNLLSYLDDESKIPIFSNHLPEIATFIYLASEGKDLSELSDKFVTQICTTVFNFKSKLYGTLLTLNEEAENSTTPNWAILEFFKEMHELVQKQDNIFGAISGTVVCAALMKRIMCELFKEKRSDLEPLKIIGLFCALSGVDIPLVITTDSCCNSIFKGSENKSSINIVALNSILEGCSSSSQYFSLTTAPEGHLKPSDWLEGLMFVLLDVNHSKHKTLWLRCFRSLMKVSLSVVENNLAAIIKSCLFSISVDDVNSKQEYCNLFIDLISLYSRLHQLPKFLVKFLLALTECVEENSGRHCFSKGQIFPAILETLAIHIQEMPFGQVLEMWKIFSETFTTFGNMCQVFTKERGAVFYHAQLFSNFLLHSKLFDPSVPSATYSKFGDMILHTKKELKKNNSILCDESKDAAVLQHSFLSLCFALGEVNLAYNDCHEENSNDDLVLRFPDSAYDCTLLLKFLDEAHTNIFNSLLKGEDKISSFLVFQLLIQKIRGLLRKKELSEDEKTHLQDSISCTLQHAKEYITSNASWDLDLCTLDASNYGTAIWRIYLKYLPLILSSVDTKALLTMCGCFRDIILQPQTRSTTLLAMDLKSVVLYAVQSGYFQESKNFQIAFVASVWKLDSTSVQKKRSCDEMELEENYFSILMQLSVFRSKWTKYAESTPKCSEEETLNALWINMKDTCSLLNQALQSKSVVRPKLKTEIFNILQLIDCLPLEYLLPGNQVRCIVGLSVLLFLTPESCNSNDAFAIAEKISKLLIAIFDGVRSVWFFDFVNSGGYLREISKTLDRLMSMKSYESLEWPKALLHSVISLIIRKKETLVAAEDYFSELSNEDKISETSSLMLLLTLQKLVQAFRKAHLHPEYKGSCEKLAVSLCSCCVKFLKKSEEDNRTLYSTLVQSYTEVIEILTSPSCNFEERKKEKYLKQIPKIIKIAQQSICDKNSNNDAYFRFYTTVCKHKQDIASFIPENFHTLIWESVWYIFQQQCSVANSTISNESVVTSPVSLKEEEIDLLQSLLSLMSQQEIDAILEQLFQQMENVDFALMNVYSLQMNLNIIKQIIYSDSKKQESSLPTATLINLLSHLCRISSNRENDVDFYLNMVKIPVLHFVNFILKQKKSVIPRHHLIHCFQVCEAVKVQKSTNNLPLFLKTFEAVWNVIYNLLVNHSEVVLSSTHAFMHIVIILLRSLISVGSQELFFSQDKNIQSQIIQSAQNMDRLLTVMARHKTSFAKLVPSIVAEYVNCVQHFTLESQLKEHLISGINRLLSLCSEDALKTIAVNINHSCRDIFSNIVKNYKQFRYRGDV